MFWTFLHTKFILYVVGHFAINDSTGALIVFAPLDREAHPQYNLTVLARDMAERNSKSASINIM